MYAAIVAIAVVLRNISDYPHSSQSRLGRAIETLVIMRMMVQLVAEEGSSVSRGTGQLWYVYQSRVACSSTSKGAVAGAIPAILWTDVQHQNRSSSIMSRLQRV